MKLNRVRTVVTILGIILSTAMFTAVTTSVSSYMNYFSNYIEYRSGSWSYSLYNLQQKELKEYVSDEKVDSYAFLQNQGFAIAKGCTNPNKPYFCIEGLGGTDPGLLPIHLTEGRMPKDSTELVIAAHAQSNGEIDIEVGQTITLEVGKRMSDGMQLYNHTGFLGNGTTNPS